ncbi:MAG: sulfatase [Bryobacterales bacterium]|nr:sulfatase [Bryobacterales bacterium]
MLTRRQALGSLLAAPAALQAQARAAKPNIVFVLIDDMRWDCLSILGHPIVKTPNIDRLAKEGVLFSNAFVTTPLCSPARGSFLTGRYVRSHGVKDNTDNNELSHKLITWPRLLQDSGYETAYVGKWHMGNEDMPRPGFDRWVSFRGQGVFNDPPLNIDGERVQKKGYITDLLSDYAVEFIEKPHTKPFAVYLAHKAVHGPFTPAERHAQAYANAKIERAASAQDTLEGKPMLQRPYNQPPPKKAPGQRVGGPTDDVIKDQMRCLLSIDEGLGRILQALEKTKALDNTLVLFTSDNGYFWGEHRLGDKRAAYEESIRIPMVARFPKLIKPGRRAGEMVLNIDIAPTMLEMAGAKPHPQVQGRSLVPLFKGNAKNWRRSFLCEYFYEKQFPRIAAWEAVRTERWKYIHYFDLSNADELYDLKADPMEMKNVIGESGAQKELEGLKKELERYRQEIRA